MRFYERTLDGTLESPMADKAPRGSGDCIMDARLLHGGAVLSSKESRQLVSEMRPAMRSGHDNRRLVWHVIFLFLLGLVTGLLEQRFTNMRMGLAAHLEGVMNGTFLVALAAIWTEVRLPPTAKAAAYWTALYGTYANWLTTTFAAIFGTAAANPIISAGHHGQPWQEQLAAAGFLSVAIVIITSVVLILWGLRARVAQNE